MINFPSHVQTNFLNPTFLLKGLCTVIQELLYLRQFGIGVMRDVVSVARHSSSELPYSLRRASFSYILLFCCSFLGSLFLVFSEMWNNMELLRDFYLKDSFSSKLLYMAFRADTVFFRAFWLGIVCPHSPFSVKDELKKASYQSTAIQTMQSISWLRLLTFNYFFFFC